MALLTIPTEADERMYTQWVEARPARVRDVARRFRPWILYRMKSTGHRVTIYSFGESANGVTLTVAVTGEFNLVQFERRVFGIDPDDLEECELPAPGKRVGSSLTQDEVRKY